MIIDSFEPLVKDARVIRVFATPTGIAHLDICEILEDASFVLERSTLDVKYRDQYDNKLFATTLVLNAHNVGIQYAEKPTNFSLWECNEETFNYLKDLQKRGVEGYEEYLGWIAKPRDDSWMKMQEPFNKIFSGKAMNRMYQKFSEIIAGLNAELAYDLR